MDSIRVSNYLGVEEQFEKKLFSGEYLNPREGRRDSEGEKTV
jgi:hypothetical protein